MSKQAPQKQSRYKLPHSVIVHAPGLLPMMYRTRELAEELGVATQTVVTWAKNGVPHGSTEGLSQPGWKASEERDRACVWQITKLTASDVKSLCVL
jgi:hypothetical protein